jgi:hypothetical protein
VPGGLYRFSAGLQTAGEDNAATGDLDLRQPVTIAGAGAANRTIDANRYDRVFDVLSGDAGTNEISGVTIENGMTGGSGGGVQASAPLTLNGVVITTSTGGGRGGGAVAASSPTAHSR